jgi:hypothetical protein
MFQMNLLRAKDFITVPVAFWQCTFAIWNVLKKNTKKGGKEYGGMARDQQ